MTVYTKQEAQKLGIKYLYSPLKCVSVLDSPFIDIGFKKIKVEDMPDEKLNMDNGLEAK